MTKTQLLFDSNIIYKLIRESPQDAVEKLSQGSTIYLAYYELGNALWRECLLLKRISIEEAKKSLDLMYSILDRMQVASLDNEIGTEVLDIACKFNLTFYDTAYLAEAKKSGKTLVTDDVKLAKAAENLGIKNLSSKTLLQ
ncbi:MAG TPA: type II toxin-antitoxin system VapC family toxin [Candidatus Nanoarchaeia archaeon]|nr:type II toxin-antitoxin system VapC family toxin [Candidatus Nanoarchaeia archaeon]